MCSTARAQPPTLADSSWAFWPQLSSRVSQPTCQRAEPLNLVQLGVTTGPGVDPLWWTLDPGMGPGEVAGPRCLVQWLCGFWLVDGVVVGSERCRGLLPER